MEGSNLPSGNTLNDVFKSLLFHNSLSLTTNLGFCFPKGSSMDQIVREQVFLHSVPSCS